MDQLKAGVDFFETLDGKKRYICSICEKDFGRESSLKQHNADAHEEKEALKCSKDINVQHVTLAFLKK